MPQGGVHLQNGKPVSPVNAANPWERWGSGVGGPGDGAWLRRSLPANTSLCAISHFLLMETILPSKKKITFSPHLMMWTSAKLNVLRGGQPTSIKEKSQTPVFCWSVLPWKQTPGDGKCGKSFNVPAKRKNTFSFLYVGQPHLARQRPAEWKVICAKPSWAVSWAQQAVTWTQTNRNLEKEPAA